jgi:hypothetical protein
VTSHADRAGELAAERRHAWDERKPRCCKKPYVWDVDPEMHLGALVPDLVALDEPPARIGMVRIAGRSVVGDLNRRLPSCRAGNQLGPLLGA